MDWYAWLCRAGLHPDAALEYALLFARNELGAADVRHLDHEFLATMGVAVAKHRLEILKLARKESSSSHGKAVAAAITALPWRATRLLAAAVHRSARSALARLRASVSSSSSSPSRGLGRRGRSGGGGDRAAHAHALLAAPRLTLPARRRGGGGRAAAHGWSKIAASPSPARAGKLPLAAMMLTNVSKPVLLTSSRADRWWSSGATAVKALPAPAAAVVGCLPSTEARSCGEDEDEEMDAGEEMRWEAMFQDLKPT